jgi:6-phosphofructokinase 1
MIEKMQGAIAILCSGGDVSGMNPAIKHFVEYSIKNGLKPYFILNGFEGMIDGDIHEASYEDVHGIIPRGGTIIGSARSKRFFESSFRERAKEHLDCYGIDKLVVLGGDGSFRGLDIFFKEHDIAFVGIPSTIDNDIVGTEYCLGVDTALNTIRMALDSIRDTASSFKRAFVVETMGRECGYLALVSALTSGAELCLIPELNQDLSYYKKPFQQALKEGRAYFLAVVAEGVSIESQAVAKWFEEEVGIEARVTVLGHIQRGGNPTSRDRLMAYQFINFGIDSLLSGKKDAIVCYNNGFLNAKSIKEVANISYQLDSTLIRLFFEDTP